MRFIMAIFCAVLLTAVSTTADARPRHKHKAVPATAAVIDIRSLTPNERADYYARGGLDVPVKNAGRETRIIAYADGYEGRVVGGRPAGCPWRYCGCEVSLKVFGRIIPELNLAYNWRKFPHSSPASGMVAYRSGHVFLIESVVDPQTVVAYDPNSGGHRTRIHTVSLRGFTVVNPHGNRMASN